MFNSSIRTDHGREFDIEVQFREFCNANGITHNFSAPRTPQSNGVIERKNRTLQEMNRTIFNEQSLPQKVWCNVKDTSTYILNRILIKSILSKTPYELLRGRKPTLDYFKVFGSKCFILNAKDYLTKFDLKSYEDEDAAIKVTRKKNLENDIKDETLKIDEVVNIKESRKHPLENVIGNLNQRTLSIIFGSTCQDMCDEFAKIMHDKFEMSMMGEINFFLGLQIKQMKDSIFFNQSKYIKEMHKKIGLEDSKPMKIPMSSDTKLMKDEECELVDSIKYQGMIGLWYPKGTDIETVVYADSDHARDYVDQKSTSVRQAYLVDNNNESRPVEDLKETERYRSYYETPSPSSSPTLPVRKSYQGTSKLVADTEDDSSDLNTKIEGSEDEGPSLEDEGHGSEDKGLSSEDDEEEEAAGNLKDDKVYIDIPTYVPPVAPVQTPPSPKWSSGSLPVSPSSLVVPTSVASPVTTPATTIAVDEDEYLKGYDRDLRELYTRSGAVRDEIFSYRYMFRSLEREQERATVTFSAIWRPILALDACVGQTNAQKAALWHAIYDIQRENHDLRMQIAEERRE
nr:retrovirus-related Pol polyprotein from transposon TNT 1-94 [Tanacetum cinerariifolium]